MEVTVIGRSTSAEKIVATPGVGPAVSAPSAATMRRAYLAGQGFSALPIHDGRTVECGATIAGPAIIEEVTTTIVVPPGWALEHQPGSLYLMTHAG